MPQIVGTGGHRSWSMTQDDSGHRDYQIVFRVQVDSPGLDGPYTALRFTPGLPQPGQIWQHNNDLDLWAHIKKRVDVREVQEKEGAPVKFFDITYHASTRPDDVCQDIQIEDPLLIPQKKNGSSIKYVEEATHDRFGRPLLTSSFEQLRGPHVEFDHNRDQIRITQNVALLQLDLCTSMRDTLNAFTLWGLPRRCIKLSDFSWEENYYGQCLVYFTRHFTFDISYKRNPMTGLIEGGFDRDVLDEGSKALKGKFNSTTGEYELTNIAGQPPDPNNPTHFDRFQDRQGNVCRVILNGAGLPAGIVVAGTGLFISIVDSNLGNKLTDRTKWIPLNGDGSYAPWDQFKFYSIGDLVSRLSSVYVAKANSSNNDPPSSPGEWVQMDSIQDAGGYDDATTYDKGDYVIDSQNTKAAMIHIEKYDEHDFLLLGIPAIIGP